MTTLKTLVNRRWWWVTLLVIAGVILLAWLGVWQLDRLEQRRAYNTMVAEKWRQEPFDVNQERLPADPAELEFRRVVVHGEYDYANQVVLTNQTRGNAPGVNLLTPLLLEDGRAILIARGWVPAHLSDSESATQFDEPDDVPIVGLLQESQTLPNGRPVTVPETPQREWYYVSLEAIETQLPYELLPVFIFQLPEEGRLPDALPFRYEPVVLSEGNHLSYAVQWFMFALILGFGYIQFVRYQERREARLRAAALEETEASDAALPTVGNNA